MRTGTPALVALAAFALLATACGSDPGAHVSSTSPHALTDGERARHERVTEQLHAFVPSIRAQLGDDYVSTSGVTDEDTGVVTRFNVILLDRPEARARVDEVRQLFAATVPALDPAVMHVVFTPFTEAELLAAYEAFNEGLRRGDLQLTSFVSMTVDREAGALAVVLDGGRDESAQDAARIRDWAATIAPVPLHVTIDPHPGRYVPAAGA